MKNQAYNAQRAFTLLELLIASVLLATVSLAMWSIVEFSRYHVGNAELRARIQNDASLVIDHMNRNIGQSIGQTALGAAMMPVDINAGPPYTTISFSVDDNPQNGRQDATDTVMAYRWRSNGGDAYEVHFCPDCNGAAKKPCNNCNPNWNATEAIGTNIEYFGAFNPPAAGLPALNGNQLEIQIQACADAASGTCGANTDNPRVTIRTRIKMPAVSTR